MYILWCKNTILYINYTNNSNFCKICIVLSSISYFMNNNASCTYFESIIKNTNHNQDLHLFICNYST